MSKILVVSKKLKLKKFKRTYGDKDRKDKEEMERVHEKKVENPRFMIMLKHKLKNKGKKLMVTVNLLFRPWR